MAWASVLSLEKSVGDTDNSVVTGPTPGSSSSCSSAAVARLTLPPRAAAAVPAVAAPGASRRGTITCAPSASGAARTPLRSARRLGAACMLFCVLCPVCRVAV
jgi:hypothetical protein